MKKIAVILIAIMLVLTLIACDKGPAEETPSPTKPAIPTEPESTPEETPVESPSESKEPDSSEPDQSETEPSSSETEPQPESETNKPGVIERPRDEF